MCLGQQEQADLRDMGAGRDVDQHIFGIGVQRQPARKVQQLAVDLLEIPRVLEVDDMPLDLCFGRDGGNVIPDIVGQTAVHGPMDHHEAIHPQVFVHAQAHRGPPLHPA